MRPQIASGVPAHVKLYHLSAFSLISIESDKFESEWSAPREQVCCHRDRISCAPTDWEGVCLEQRAIMAFVSRWWKLVLLQMMASQRILLLYGQFFITASHTTHSPAALSLSLSLFVLSALGTLLSLPRLEHFSLTLIETQKLTLTVIFFN